MNSSKKLLDNTCSLLICHVGLYRNIFYLEATKMFNSIKKVVSIVWWKKSCSYIFSCVFGSTLPPHVLIIERTAASIARSCSPKLSVFRGLLFDTSKSDVFDRVDRRVAAWGRFWNARFLEGHPSSDDFSNEKVIRFAFFQKSRLKKQVFSKSIALSQVLRSFRSAQSDLQWRPVTETLERRSRTAKCCRCDWTDISFAGYLFWWCKWS